MKILHIIDSGGLYGAEIMLLNLATEQMRQGHQVVLASIGEHGCGEKALEERAAAAGIVVWPVRMRPGPNWVGAGKIIRFIRRNKIEILHSHGYKGNILFGFIPKRYRVAPMVSTMHGWTSVRGWSKIRLYEWADRLSLRFVDAVVLVSQSMREYAFFRHAVNHKVFVIENGIASEPPVAEVGDNILSSFCSNRWILGCVGRLSPEKGQMLLLKAMHRLLNQGIRVKLVCIGDGNDRGILERLARRLGMEEDVLFTGYLSDASHYFSLFDIMVMPSLTEGLPITLLEAMRAELPIVATKVGGVPEMLDQGRCGRLVKPGCEIALFHGIKQMIEDTGYRQECRRNGKIRFRECYSREKMAARYTRLYTDLLQS